MEERLARFKEQEQKQAEAAARLEEARQEARAMVEAREAVASVRMQLLQLSRDLSSEPTPTPASLRAEFQEPEPTTPRPFVSLRANACGDVDEEVNWGPCGPPPPPPVLRRQNAVDLDDVPSLPPPPPQLSRSEGNCLCCCGYPTTEPVARVLDFGEHRAEAYEEDEDELDEERRRNLQEYKNYSDEHYLMDQANEAWQNFMNAAPWMRDEHIEYVIEAMEELRAHYKKVNDELYS